MQLLRKTQSQFIRLNQQQIFFQQIFNLKISFQSIRTILFKFDFEFRKIIFSSSSSSSQPWFVPKVEAISHMTWLLGPENLLKV